MGTIENLISNVDNTVFSFVHGSFGGLTNAVQVLWHLMFIVFIAVYGYRVMVSGRFSSSDLTMNCLKIIVLLVLATSWDTFFTFIYRMTTEAPADLAGHLIQGAAHSFSDPVASDQTTANTALSTFHDRGMKVAEKILEGPGWSFEQYFYAALVMIGTFCITGFATALIILSKLAVATMLAVGPIALLLLMFPNTKGLFEGWLRTLLNYSIIPVFVYGLLALLLTIAEGPLRYMEANSGVYDSLMTPISPYLLMSIVAVILLAQVKGMAASITGGLSLSTLGAGAATWQMATKPIRAAGSAGWGMTKNYAKQKYSERKALQKSLQRTPGAA